MRVIGGKFRSRKLKSLKGDLTRPTANKVKGAVFSSIAFDVNHNLMLDLFAGSGAMGIEALSRGFKHVYFNDVNKKAYDVILFNLKTLDLLKSSSLSRLNYQDLLKKFSNKNKFDFIFIDPPYKKINIDEILKEIVDYEILAKGGVVCVESVKEEKLKNDYKNLLKYKEKIYGLTKLTYYRKEE